MSAQFAPYARFVARLRALLRVGVDQDSPFRHEAYEAALDGEAANELIRLVPIAARRRGGTFFTGSVLAGQLAARIPTVDQDTRILDPTLGAGDLLIAAARRIPRGKTVRHALDIWDSVFAGVDREILFVQAARLRLWLLAHMLQDVPVSGVPATDQFGGLECGDLWKRPHVFEWATDILLNPPFSRIAAPSWYTLGGGKVNAAALVVDFAIRHSRSGVRLHAILPEVLRTGSLYARWRSAVAGCCEVRDVHSCGIFDSADVDVFMVTLEKRRRALATGVGRWPARRPTLSMRLERQFDVSVGAVVDFRDPRRGPERAFIHPRNVPAWEVVRRVIGSRAFEGTVVKPPFVVLRRTSRPGDRWRAAASIITGKRVVAVENHLLVCRPLAGGLRACRGLLRELQTGRVNWFLDREMRCRHLTVDVVKRIPLSYTGLRPGGSDK